MKDRKFRDLMLKAEEDARARVARGEPARLPLRAAKDKEKRAGVIHLNDAIGDWFGISAADFVAALEDMHDTEHVTVYINSPGGDVFAAWEMYSAIDRHPGHVTAHITAMCASAATFLSTACDEVVAEDAAMYMIHSAWSIAIGNAEQFRKAADLLDDIDGGIVRAYVYKTGASEARVSKWMEDETWFSADEARKSGFIDAVIAKKPKKEKEQTYSAETNMPILGRKEADVAAIRRQIEVLAIEGSMV